MAIVEFPPVELANEHGLLAVGGDLEVESLLLAYRSGIFPWPIYDDNMITWFAPRRRAVLFLRDFHIPRKLRGALRNNTYTFKIDMNFELVVRACAQPKNREKGGTWITTQIIEGYLALHEDGYAHSVECYDGAELVGGLYGVSIGKMFAGESMFFRTSNASKLCLCFLVDYLGSYGVQWIDCQQMTTLLESFGAVEIERGAFMKLLKQAVGEEIDMFCRKNIIEQSS